ncbi:MAG TPA: polysaccharide deacetylase family protein [Segetibacter sp.]
MYLVKTPWWLRKLYGANLTWKIATERDEIFLTFDDGPHPEATPFVLNCLRQFNAKATFFCIGKNVQQYPEIYKQIIDEGHKTGNHTYNHLNGWKTNDATYLKNVMFTQKYVDSTLFRPPYGRISRFQANQLKPVFDIIMWDVLSGDFDTALTPQKCLENVTGYTVPGSIIVFHDSQKAFKRLEYALPKAIEFFAGKGYAMKTIESK